MPRPAVTRATVAGLSTTALLLAAVVTVSVLLGGLVAYTASPDGPLVSGRPSLELPAAEPAGQGTTVALVVPPAPARAAAPAAPAAPPAATDPPRDDTSGPRARPASAVKQPAASGDGDRSSAGTTTATTPPPTPTTPARPQAPVPPPVTSVTDALADTTAATGQGLGDVVKGATAGLGAGALPAVGQVLKQVGEGLGTIVTAATDAVAGLVRGLGAPAAP